MQLLLGIVLVTLSLLEPKSQLGWFSLLAGIGALASATQDIAINAWRIDVADEKATLDILSTVYQMGYRLSSLVGGALGLIIAERIGWPQTYLVMGAILLAIGVAGLFAPDTTREKATGIGPSAEEFAEFYKAGEVRPEVRNRFLWQVVALWGWALLILGIFMVRALGGYVPMLPVLDLGAVSLNLNWVLGMFPLGEEGRPDPTEFTAKMGPFVIAATIILPAIIAARLHQRKASGRDVIGTDEDMALMSFGARDHLYRALLVPLVEFVGRIGWPLILILALVLTYRICDAIWGTFAYPFYLGELNYSGDEVAFASKFFGVGAIIAGLALGGYMLTVIGRMATLTIGALLAALTNLLYADMAVGGANMQWASDAVGFLDPDRVPGAVRVRRPAPSDVHHHVRKPRHRDRGSGLCRLAVLDRIEGIRGGAIRAAVLAHPASGHAGARRAGRDDRRAGVFRRLRADHLHRLDRRRAVPRRMVAPIARCEARRAGRGRSRAAGRDRGGRRLEPGA